MASQFSVKGMTVEQLLDLDMDIWVRLNRRDLATATRRLADAANKRLKYFDDRGDYSPATRAAERSGGKFSTAGKNRNQLEHEFVRARNFLMMETSTMKGWSKVKDRTIAEFARTTGVTIPKEKFNEFWEAYEDLRDLDPDIINRAIKYKVMEELVQRLLDGQDPEEIVTAMHARITEIYKESKKEEASSSDGGTGKYFKGQ